MIRFIAFVAVSIWMVLPALGEVKIQEVRTKGGITAYLVHEPSIPFVALQLAFRGGTALDDQNKAGATNLMMGLLEEGAADKDAAAFLRATEELAASFSFTARRDSVSISAQMLSSNLNEAVELLRQAIVSPIFDPVAIERVRGQVLSSLKGDETDPQVIARQTMNSLAFPDHPYSRASDGTIQSVTGLTRQDMINAHQNALAKDQLVVGVVGDITPEKLAPMLDQLLEGLPATGKALPERIPFQAQGGITVVDFDSPQSTAIWAQPGLRQSDKDFMAVYVMNHILGGGGFGSRLTDEVREKRGLTYGIFSYVVAMDLAEFIGGEVASGNATTKEAIDVVLDEWAKFSKNGPTEKELVDAKKYLTGSYPLRFDSNAKIARILVGMQLSNLGIGYINSRNDILNALTIDDIRRVSRKYLDVDAVRVVVVGKPEGVKTAQ